MKIHYQNGKGQEVFIDNIVHLQNVDDNIWIALTKDEKELTLVTSRIEGIADMGLLNAESRKQNDKIARRHISNNTTRRV